jgi:hypothetical protein
MIRLNKEFFNDLNHIIHVKYLFNIISYKYGHSDKFINLREMINNKIMAKQINVRVFEIEIVKNIND